MFKGTPVGVVQVINSKTGTFSEAELPTLEITAILIGYAIYHARLYDDIASLKKLDQEKAQFMRTLVHELKSPAAATKMLTDMLKGRDDVAPDLEQLHDRIGTRMEEMLALISDILVLAKSKSGETMGEIAVVDMAAMTSEACEQYRLQAEQKNIGMDLVLPEEKLTTRIDTNGCNLVLSNLVSNAVKYTNEGRVTVNLRREDKWVVLDVTDSGIGIPEKDIPKLFNEFFRASNAKKQKIQGSGVGLSSIKNIVERFDGQMELQSVENEGSTFTVRLPYFEE